MRVKEGLEAVNGEEMEGSVVPGYLRVKIGTGLYFDEQGRLCASGGGVITTGIADEVATTETQSEGSGITETVQVNDSVNFTKF